jgi:hypothetical protein
MCPDINDWLKLLSLHVKKKESLSPSWIQKLAELFYASESYVAARLAFRSVGFFYVHVAQPSSYDAERTPDQTPLYQRNAPAGMTVITTLDRYPVQFASEGQE